MIRIYDSLGRIKEEIDPSQDDVYIHVSYVREAPPYVMVDHTAYQEPIIDQQSRRKRTRSMDNEMPTPRNTS